MTKFANMWNTEVKPLAQACIMAPELLRIINMGEEYIPTPEEASYLHDVQGKYKDLYGIYCISDMIWRVDHALADGKEDVAKLFIVSVYEVLNGSSYLKNIFKDDESNEEWKTREALKSGLYKLMYV